MIKFPQKGTPIYQAPRGNVRGNLWSTFNIDLQSNPGRIRLGDKLAQIYSSADDADLGLPVAFEFFNAGWYAICGTKIFVQGSSAPFGNAWLEDTATGAQTNYEADFSDLAIFNERIWATTATGLYSGTGSAWTSRASLGNNLHKLAYLKNTDRLYFTGDNSSFGNNSLSSIGTDDVEFNPPSQYSINVSSGGGSVGDIIRTIAASDKDIYISVVAVGQSYSSSSGNVGKLLIWDGINQQAYAQVIMEDSGGLVAMKVYNGILYGVDTRARVLRFNGSGFDEIARLPHGEFYGIRSADLDSNGASYHVHHNGIDFTENNTMLIAVNGRRTSNLETLYSENVPSGIWECDLATGNLTHKHSFTYKGYTSSTVTDFGQQQIYSIGAVKLQKMNRAKTGSVEGRADIICGASFFTDGGAGTDSADKSAIFLSSGKGGTSDYEGEKRGYFVTTWIDSENMQDVWQKLGIKHREFLNANDKIVAKYRTREYEPTYATITWTSTTTFTTTTDISAYWTSGTGGEVEVIRGFGGGTVAHITSIVNNAGTYTVTIDEIATGVSNNDTATARFQHWTKIAAVTLQNLESEIHAIGASSERIQLKFVMHFTGDGEFHEMQLVNKPHIQLE